jgi:hypothetical protein
MSALILGITISAIILAIFFTGGSLSWLFTTKEHKDGNYRGVDTIKDTWDNLKNPFSGGKKKKIKTKK